MQSTYQKSQFGMIYIIIIVVIVAIAIGILFMLMKSPPSTTVFRGPFPLSANKSIVQASDFKSVAESTIFLTAGEATFQAFVYLDTLSKTGTYSACGTASNQPDCSGGLYGVCQCTSRSDCKNCAHDGYKNVLSLYGVYRLEILNVPDASRQNAVSAQLVVKTTAPKGDGTNDIFSETVPLPPISMQKWVMITISHEGRRVDVCYNDNMVSSYTLENTILNSNFDITYVNAGDNSVSGSIGLLRFYPSRLPLTQVSNIYASLVDTRGAPTELVTDSSTVSASITAPTPGSLLSRLNVSGLRAPSITISDIGNIYGTDSKIGSISSVYSLTSPYA